MLYVDMPVKREVHKSRLKELKLKGKVTDDSTEQIYAVRTD